MEKTKKVRPFDIGMAQDALTSVLPNTIWARWECCLHKMRAPIVKFPALLKLSTWSIPQSSTAPHISICCGKTGVTVVFSFSTAQQ